MMLILFLLALFLAWPTFGLSLVAYVAFLFLRGYLKGKTQAHEANVRRAESTVVSGPRTWPSWTSDKAEALIFLETIQQSAIARGVPHRFLQGILAETGNTQGLYLFAGAMEREGASFLEQQAACSEKLVEMWNSASPQGKRAIMDKGENAVAAQIRQTPINTDFDDEIPF